MRHTILIATFSSVVASVVTVAVISGSPFGAGTASSADTPVEASLAVSPAGIESVIQGDVDCRGVAPNEVATRDSQAILRHVLEQNPLSQDEPCPDVGTVIPAGVTGLEIVSARSPIDSTSKGIVAECPAGKKLIGGGAEISLTAAQITTTRPFSDEAWLAVATEVTPTAQSWWVDAIAICANVAE